MKKKNIIILLYFLWGISIMVVFFAVYKYIDKKNDNTTLRIERQYYKFVSGAK